MTIVVVNMTRMGHDRWRGVMSGFALALFLTGSNYCLVGGIASHFGARVSCMAPGGTASGSCHEAPGASHCAQAASPHRGAPGPAHGPATPPRAATPPCCVALSPVLAMPGVKIVASDLIVALPAVPATLDPAPLPVSWHGHRIFRDAGPPSLHSRAPLSLRAPPLA